MLPVSKSGCSLLSHVVDALLQVSSSSSEQSFAEAYDEPLDFTKPDLNRVKQEAPDVVISDSASGCTGLTLNVYKSRGH